MRETAGCFDFHREALGERCRLYGRPVCDVCRLHFFGGHVCPRAEAALWQGQVADRGD
jgi:hypothetical protein